MIKRMKKRKMNNAPRPEYKELTVITGKIRNKCTESSPEAMLATRKATARAKDNQAAIKYLFMNVTSKQYGRDIFEFSIPL
ncbi:MAG: hypothetical protein JSV49_08850 [Thermoplasmata archaeon]|nr:MAG: hypothetical protein JSV49_08850 [Thermoplasmata archaeon]